MLADGKLRQAVTIARPRARWSLTGELDVHRTLVELDLSLDVSLAAGNEVIAHNRRIVDVSTQSSPDTRINAELAELAEQLPGARA